MLAVKNEHLEFFQEASSSIFCRFELKITAYFQNWLSKFIYGMLERKKSERKDNSAVSNFCTSFS